MAKCLTWTTLGTFVLGFLHVLSTYSGKIRTRVQSVPTEKNWTVFILPGIPYPRHPSLTSNLQHQEAKEQVCKKQSTECSGRLSSL